MCWPYLTILRIYEFSYLHCSHFDKVRTKNCIVEVQSILQLELLCEYEYNSSDIYIAWSKKYQEKREDDE